MVRTELSECRDENDDRIVRPAAGNVSLTSVTCIGAAMLRARAGGGISTCSSVRRELVSMAPYNCCVECDS